MAPVSRLPLSAFGTNVWSLVIEGYGYRWYRVGGLDYLLRRTEIDTPPQ